MIKINEENIAFLYLTTINRMQSIAFHLNTQSKHMNNFITTILFNVNSNTTKSDNSK